MPSKPINSDLIVSGADGYDFEFAQETATIGVGIIVQSDTFNGIFSDKQDSVLVNNGTIASGTSFGVVLNGTNASAVNAIGASISGWLDGITFAKGNTALNNSGTIIGATDIGVLFTTTTTSVTAVNRGSVFGSNAGVETQSTTANGTIKNFGLIRSDDVGVHVFTAVGLVTTINNAATGTIKGAGDAIEAASGRFSLTNLGIVAGAILDNAGEADTVVNHGILKGQVLLGGGNDTFNGNGGGAAAVFGGPGKDHLIGGAKADQLHGGDANDTLTGGGGADRFYFDTGLNAATNVDTITDFTPGSDKIALSHAIFGATNASGALAAAMFSGNGVEHSATRIVYNPNNGVVYYDPDGSASGSGKITFAKLDTHLTLHNTDFVIVA